MHKKALSIGISLVLLICLSLMGCQQAAEETMPTNTTCPQATEAAAETTAEAAAEATAEASDLSSLNLTLPDWLTQEKKSETQIDFMDSVTGKRIGGIIALELTDEQIYEIDEVSQAVAEQAMPKIDANDMEWNFGSHGRSAYYSIEMGNSSNQYEHNVVKLNSRYYDVWFDANSDVTVDNLRQEIVQSIVPENYAQELKAFSQEVRDREEYADAQKYNIYLEFPTPAGMERENQENGDYLLKKDGKVIGGYAKLNFPPELANQKIPEYEEEFLNFVQENVMAEISQEDFEATMEAGPFFWRGVFRNDNSVYYHTFCRHSRYDPCADLWFDGNQISVEDMEAIVASVQTVREPKF